MRKLFDYQQEIVDKSSSRNGVALFMDTRTGKTITCIRWVKNKSPKKVLIVSTLSPLISWKEELEKEGVDCVFIRGKPEERLSIFETAVARSAWCVTNYETLLRASHLIKEAWDCVVLDESSVLINPKNKISKLVMRHLAKARLRAVLTATPTEDGKPEQVFTQLAFVAGGQFMGHGNFWRWRDTYMYQAGYDWELKAGVAEKIEAEISKYSFTARRKTLEIGSSKRRRVVRVRMSEDEMREYKETEKEWTYKQQEAKHLLTVFHWLRRNITGRCKAKIKALVSLSRDSKVLVITNYKMDLRKCWDALRGIGKRVWFIDGTTKDRAAKLKAFADSNDGALIAQVRTLRFGLDISSCDRIIFFSGPWSSIDRSQAEDRLIHPTKSRPIEVVDIIVKDTVEEDVYKSIRQKNKSFSKLMKTIEERVNA